MGGVGRLPGTHVAVDDRRDTPPPLSIGVVKPEPIVIGWNGTQVRVRHDDSHLTPYSPGVFRLRSAFELASDVDGQRLVLESTMGERYRVSVRDDGAVVGLWRRG